MREIPVPQRLQIPEDYQNLLSSLVEYIEEQEITAVSIISGNFAKQEITHKLDKDLRQYLNDIHIVNNIEDAERTNEWIIAIGGGKLLDKAKVYAKKNNSRLIAIPTLIAHDGICSPVAVIDGKSMGALMPDALIVPLFIIARNTIAQIQAGIGDLVANLSAIEDWKLAKSFNNEKIDDFAIMLSRRAAMNVLQHLEADIKSGLKVEDIIYQRNFLKSLIESLSLSGIAMSISGNSRPCSGAEHMISHAIDEIHGSGKKASHGTQVMIATVYLESLRGYDLLDNLYNAKSIKLEQSDFDSRLTRILKSLNFPTTFSDIDISDSELEDILNLAPTTRPGRFSFFDRIKQKV